MGTLKTTNIQTITGSGTLTLGTSGETLTVPSGVTVAGSMANTPAFCVYGSGSNQGVSSGVGTKATINNTLFDTNSAWDGTNYRWTVPSGEGGKYHITAVLGAYSSSNNISNFQILIRLNDTSYIFQKQMNNAGFRHFEDTCSFLYTLSAGDYIELYGAITATSPEFRKDGQSMWFGAYRLIGV